MYIYIYINIYIYTYPLFECRKKTRVRYDSEVSLIIFPDGSFGGASLFSMEFPGSLDRW